MSDSSDVGSPRMPLTRRDRTEAAMLEKIRDNLKNAPPLKDDMTEEETAAAQHALMSLAQRLAIEDADDSSSDHDVHRELYSPMSRYRVESDSDSDSDSDFVLRRVPPPAPTASPYLMLGVAILMQMTVVATMTFAVGVLSGWSWMTVPLLVTSAASTGMAYLWYRSRTVLGMRQRLSPYKRYFRGLKHKQHEITPQDNAQTVLAKVYANRGYTFGVFASNIYRQFYE